MNEIGGYEWYANYLTNAIEPKNINRVPLSVASPSTGQLRTDESVEFRKWALGHPSSSSIYFLWDNEELVYIGRTCFLYSRIGEHRRNPKKKFTHISAIHVLCAVDQIESFLIEKYNPKYNKQK